MSFILKYIHPHVILSSVEQRVIKLLSFLDLDSSSPHLLSLYEKVQDIHETAFVFHRSKKVIQVWNDNLSE